MSDGDLFKRIANSFESGTSFSEIWRDVLTLIRNLAAFPHGNIAYWHPLGFLIITLFKGSDCTIRLHIWPSGGLRPAEPNWPIHDHIFRVDSLVLCGSITNTTYSIKSTPEGEFKIYQVSYIDNATLLTSTNHRAQAEICGVDVISAENSYRVERGYFHMSQSSSVELTATLVYTSKAVTDPPRVLGRSDGELTYLCRRRSCLFDEYCALIGHLLNTMIHTERSRR